MWFLIGCVRVYLWILYLWSRCNVCGVYVCGVYKIEFLSQISKIAFKKRLCSLFLFSFLKINIFIFVYTRIYLLVCALLHVVKWTPILAHNLFNWWLFLSSYYKRRESYRDTHVPLDLAVICFSLYTGWFFYTSRQISWNI